MSVKWKESSQMTSSNSALALAMALPWDWVTFHAWHQSLYFFCTTPLMTPSRQSLICEIIAQSLPSVSFPFLEGSSRLPKKEDWESCSKKDSKQCSLCLFSIPHPSLHLIICPSLPYFLFFSFIHLIPSSPCVSSLCVVWVFFFCQIDTK